ncbi:MAG: PA2169 family four-helix-bundle protein [Luteibacter sp.]
MERNSIRVVNGLIRRVIADRDLYRQAAQGVREPGLKAILAESADSLTAIAGELQGEVTATGGRPATAGGPMSGVRRKMVEASVKLSSDPDVTYIRTLELMERRLLDAFLKLEASSGDRAVVGRHIARLRLLHLDMVHMGGATGR